MRKSVDRINMEDETDVIDQMQCRTSIYKKKKTQKIEEEIDEQEYNQQDNLINFKSKTKQDNWIDEINKSSEDSMSSDENSDVERFR